MKAKIGITIFGSGDVDILRNSIHEDLWRDYRFFFKKAAAHAAKGHKKNKLLAQRYERAAAMSLYTFFTSVVMTWLSRLGQSEDVRSVPSLCTLYDVLMRAVFGTAAHTEFTHLRALLCRYDQNVPALLENHNEDSLQDMENSICEFLGYIEAHSDLRRFPPVETSTTGVMEELMSRL